MGNRKAKSSIFRMFRSSALASSEDHRWLRLAGLPVPTMKEHAEARVEETRKTWDLKPATARQERFLRLRGQWHDGVTQKQAFERTDEIARLELEELGGNNKPTWSRLVDLEPRLQDLLVEAAKVPPEEQLYCAALAWYGPAGLKARMSRLVGHGAEQPGLLATSAAYDVAYDTITEALPNCDPGCPCDLF